MSSPINTLQRKWKRLSVMGIEEILFRLGRKCADQGERIVYYAGGMKWSERKWRKRLCHGIELENSRGNLAESLHRYFRNRAEPPFLLDATLLAESKAIYENLYEDRLGALRVKADRICEGKFAFLGIEFEASDPISWQRDPKTGKDWPPNFHGDVHIPFCDGIGDTEGAADVKYVWELNRHEFLIDCAKAYYLTGETLYAERVFTLISSWIRCNPYLQGVNWAGPLEVAVRAIAWLWCYQFCRSWEDFADDAHLELIQSFYQHGAYLHRHIERYSSPNNHWIGEATALYLLGSFFPEFDEASRWKKQAWDILAAEPENQFYADGGSAEQSTSYHHYCLGFFLLAMMTRLRQKLPVPQSMRKRLEAAMDFSLWMTTPDGTVPRIGDGDDSRSIRFEPAAFWDFRSFLSLGAVLFKRSDFKSQAGTYGEDALWLLGAEGYRTYENLPSQSPKEIIKIFPESGYAILRSGWEPHDDHLCFDGGPVGKGLYAGDIPIFTHGHADMLSLMLCAFGWPLLIDSGFYTFSGSPDWHRYCRDVRGHNTLSVDGASAAKFNSANAWSCAAEPGPILCDEDHNTIIVKGSHSGFYGIEGQVRHRRTVLWQKDILWAIQDELEGTGSHFVEVFFHFAPGRTKTFADGKGLLFAAYSGVHAVLRCEGSNSLQVEILNGQQEPDGGWIATSYGCRTAAPCVRFFGHVSLPEKFTFILTPFLSFPDEITLDNEENNDDEDDIVQMSCDIS